MRRTVPPAALAAAGTGGSPEAEQLSGGGARVEALFRARGWTGQASPAGTFLGRTTVRQRA